VLPGVVARPACPVADQIALADTEALEPIRLWFGLRRFVWSSPRVAENFG